MLWHIDSQRDGRVGHDALSNLIIVLRAKFPILRDRDFSEITGQQFKIFK